MVYNVLKSKVEMDLAFFLGINLIESINYGKCVLNYPEVIIVRVKKCFIVETLNVHEYQFKNT